ncbi:hypothetical protein CA264_14330 [Pontibacter actiniarum]|uniref:DUF2339 domain-containing protein n=2 Tax=Pontibacter actiniarum TaxID=323450 RepID=A0A1X9YUI6_9BACT|nr:hypothetical protein CA264_14330 [Pontibacter actiniarum]
MRKEMQLLREQLEKQATPSAPPATKQTETAKESVEEVKRSLRPTPPPPAPTPAPEPVVPEPVVEQPAPMFEPEPIAAFEAPQEHSTAPSIPKLSFFQRNPDWEKFIGENLINKLGIAILVLGIGFFVKYAIDQEWINEVGRVAIGILAGGLLLGIAHRLRKPYQAFSSVLIGGGMAVLYFTIAIAFHEYALFSQTVAFILMVGITGFTIFLSLAYNRMELAVLALIGGFGSPFMVSTGEGNYAVLFTFVLILNVGILVLAYFKKWNLLNIIAYVFTIILYGGWLSTRVVGAPNPPYFGALLFATLFYLVFFLMNIINNVKEQRRFTAPEIMMLLSNTFLYYSAGMFVLHNMADGAYKGVFTLVLAAFNFVFAYLLYKNPKTDRNLVYLLIGLVLTFLSLTAPVQLEGNYITLFWALEAVLLLWLWQKSGIKLIRIASVLVLGLMLFSLVLDWRLYSFTDVAFATVLPVIFNKLFITGLVTVAALAATNYLLRQEQEESFIGFDISTYKKAVKVLLFAFLYLVLLLELNYQLLQATTTYGTRAFILGAYNYLYLLGLVYWSVRQQNASIKKGIAAATAISVAVYLLVLHPLVSDSRDLYLLGASGTLTGFWWHYLPLLLVVLILGAFLYLVQGLYGYRHRLGKLSLWFASFALVFLASAELEHIALLSSYEGDVPLEAQLSQIRRIGFAILWGVSSFVLMMIGMQRKLKTLRVISLTLFFLTLLKLFLFDIRGISEGGKIAAFICLGVLLLVVSFMYQKLKTLILEDESHTEKPAPDASL